jgi:hypothetical protein
MFGRNIGGLTVYARTSIGGEENAAWSQMDEVGDFWQRVEIQLTDARPFQLIVEGVVGNGPLGDIGIDDTSFTSGCIFDPAATLPNSTKPKSDFDEKLQFRCKHTPQTISRTKVCDFRYDCRDRSDEEDCGTCSFEDSWCGFQDQSLGAAHWTRRAPTLLGPAVDHTFQNASGHFLVTEMRSRSNLYFDDAGKTRHSLQTETMTPFYIHPTPQSV